MTTEQLINLWNKLTEYTYIYGYEDQLIDLIEDLLPKPLQRDEYGNYFIKIGDSKSLFVSHLDTVGKQKLKINKITYIKDGHYFVKTDGNTILGADDKTGVVIMLNMIDNDVPGLYYFLIGEEIGTVGSGLLYKEKSTMLSDYNRAIAFDRKSYGSIINRQMGNFCCSDEFVDALSDEFSKNGMEYKADSYGVWTDSALFMGIIPECTNLSVGYFNEHTKREEQDINYMVQLSKVATQINWESLPVVRELKSFDTDDVEFEEDGIPQYKLLNIFEEIEGLIYDETKMFSSNTNFFKPGKEMKFFGLKDIDDINNFSLYLYPNGSIKFKRDDFEVNLKDINELEQIVKDKHLKDLLKFQELKEKIITKYKDFINESKEDIYDIKYEKWKGQSEGYNTGYDAWYLYKNGIPLVGISNDNEDKNNVLIRHIESKEKGMATKFILMLLNKGISLETGKADYNSISTSAYYMNKKITELVKQDETLDFKILGKSDNRGKEKEEKYKDVVNKSDNYHYKWFKK